MFVPGLSWKNDRLNEKRRIKSVFRTDQDLRHVVLAFVRHEVDHVRHAATEHGEDGQAAHEAEEAACPASFAGALTLAADVTPHLFVPMPALRVGQIHAHDFFGSRVGDSASSLDIPVAQFIDGSLHLRLGPVSAVPRARGVYRAPLVDPVARTEVLGVPDAADTMPPPAADQHASHVVLATGAG